MVEQTNTNRSKVVAVIGSEGHVGSAYLAMLQACGHVGVIGLDEANREYSDNREAWQRWVNDKCHAAFVCVPTPEGDGGRCDTSAVDEVLAWLNTELIIIKSTVPPGFTDDRQAGVPGRLVFSPEFIGESKYHSTWPFDRDPAAAPWHIFGEAKPGGSRLAADLIAPICGPQAKYLLTDATTAEVVKLMENSFFATKITFVNEMAKVCQAFGVDFMEARELWLADPRIEPMHTMAFADAPGFGGKCLPKDLANLIHSSGQAGYRAAFLEAVQAANQRFRNGTD